MGPDPKWLDILKATGWQTGCLASAAALLIFANRKNWLPLNAPLEPWVIEIAVVACFVFGFLAFASFCSAAWKASRGPITGFLALRRAKHQIRREIPYMNEKEREVIGDLIAKNQRMFTCTADGGYANTLISKKIVVCALLPGQACTGHEVPFRVPGYAWDVLIRHRAEFPYKPPEPNMAETHPWRVHWMAR